MRILVTAGNTLVPIDQVRAITNIFTGRTGTGIALAAYQRGYVVTLLTSHPEIVSAWGGSAAPAGERWTVRPYRTFDELRESMRQMLSAGVDVLIHSAAVSDYRAAGIYAPAPGCRFRAEEARWECAGSDPPRLLDRAAGKVKSDEAELWLRLVRTPKLVDLVRTDWGFRGILIKFKLEVGVTEERLLEIAERSRQQSRADLMAANTLEGASSWALLGPLGGHYERLARHDLAPRLLDAVERLHEERKHG